MSTVTSTTNAYTVGYSTSDLSVTYPASTSTSTTASTTSTTTTSATTTGSMESVLTAATGLNVTSLVNSAMVADEAKLANLVRDAQVNTWKQDRYRSVISSLDTFSDSYFDVLNTDTYSLSPSSFSTTSATSDSNSASATATADATTGDYTITSATLAAAAKVTSNTTFTLKSSSAVSSLLSAISDSDSSPSTVFTIGGKTYKYNLDSSSIATDSTTYTGGTSSGKTTDTISTLMSNLSTLTGYTFKYSELTGKVSVANSSTGSSNSLAFSFDSTDTFMSGLFGSSSTTNSATTGTTSGTTISYAATGTDGSFTIKDPSGDSATVTQSSNKFTLDGVSYNVSSAITSSSPVTINVALDVSSAASKIEDFITNYNSLISALSAVTAETRDYNYKALSSTQEASMSSSAITAWNQKAQKGLLNGDSTINSMLSEMRTAFYTAVSGSGVSYSSVGLSTSDDYTDGGKITVDTAALKKALTANPQKVINLFSQVSTTTPSYSASLSSSALATRNSEEGIFQRISDIYQKYAGSSTSSSGYRSRLYEKAGKVGTTSETNNLLTKEIKKQVTKITDFQAKMVLDKAKYLKIYTALQTAMSKLNTQANSISSLLSSSSS